MMLGRKRKYKTTEDLVDGLQTSPLLFYWWYWPFSHCAQCMCKNTQWWRCSLTVQQVWLLQDKNGRREKFHTVAGYINMKKFTCTIRPNDKVYLLLLFKGWCWEKKKKKRGERRQKEVYSTWFLSHHQKEKEVVYLLCVHIYRESPAAVETWWLKLNISEFNISVGEGGLCQYIDEKESRVGKKGDIIASIRWPATNVHISLSFF